MSTDYRFEGWCGLDNTAAKGNMKWQEFEPKPFGDEDVDIQISHCGICGSDIHTLRSEWGETPYPCVVGHEIVGKAVNVGKSVKKIKKGDRVGVGAQALSCLKPDCFACSDNKEPYCPDCVNTFGDFYKDKSKSYGGYANYNRTHSHFVFKIPESLSSAEAAPMLCGGVTLYSPLKREGCGPGKKVGIVGLGGLGHFGVLFAKALDADSVTVISRSNTKNANSLDLIICTVSSPKMPLGGCLSLLKFQGTFIQVGAPDDSLPGFSAFALIPKQCKIAGSLIGSPAEIEEMLELAVKKNVKAWIEPRPMKEANKAVVDMEDGKARYRYVLVNENF
ncbi:GroES-like protein [Tothia fuscella]|uniref:GroES-like protein n=1 Tax=Tothia fuscella TaxID=1048955 RepID=A0A9P4NGB7_9PEZI|nr:GroES-like protein [Tothia fuscella]